MSHPGRASRPTSPLLLPLLAFGQFISAIDYNIVYVALPDIGRELGFTVQSLQWVVSAYAVAFGGLLLLGGRAADVMKERGLRSSWVSESCSEVCSRPHDEGGPL